MEGRRGQKGVMTVGPTFPAEPAGQSPENGIHLQRAPVSGLDQITWEDNFVRIQTQADRSLEDGDGGFGCIIVSPDVIRCLEACRSVAGYLWSNLRYLTSTLRV